MRSEGSVAPEALPYVNLIGELVNAEELEMPRNSGFVAIGREDLEVWLDANKVGLDAYSGNLPGELELVNLLKDAVSIRRILGITVGSRLDVERLWPMLELSVIQGDREKGVDLPCQLLSDHKLNKALERFNIRLNSSFGFRNYQGEPIDVSYINYLQRLEEELHEDMEDHGENYPGQMPSQLHYLIRLDN